jgi:MFS family permease
VRRRAHPTVQALRIRPFRRLWAVLALSSVGDWLGLLGSAVFASSQVSGPSAKGAAFGVVIAIQLLPALLLGPVAGVLADRFDRRYTMIAVDIFRFVLYLSIPVAAVLRPGAAVAYAATAVFLIQAAALLWVPAKEAAVPKLLPRSLLEAANQLTLVTTYGVAPVAGALLLAGLAKLPSFNARIGPVGLALWFDALTFLASALVVKYGIRELSGRSMGQSTRPTVRAMAGDVIAGTRFVMTNPLVRGITIGILGAFAGAGVVIGTGRFYAQSLGGGDSTFAILFAVLFTGFGLGILGGPRLVGLWSRRRSFTTSIGVAGIALIGLAISPRLQPAAAAALIVGTGAGMAFLTGVTLIGRDVSDAVRGRVFAFIQTGARVTLLGSIAVSGVLVGLGSSRRLHIDGLFTMSVASSRALLLVAGVGGIYLGWAALRQIDDRPGIPVFKDLSAIALRRPLAPYPVNRSSPPVNRSAPYPPVNRSAPISADGRRAIRRRVLWR